MSVPSKNDAPPSRLLAVRSLFLAPARRALRELLGRLPAPAQQLGGAALRAAAGRWPALSRLLGISPASATTPVEAPAPAPVSPPPTGAARGELLARLREAKDYSERARAALALAQVTDAEATAALVAALRDASSEVASQAAESLAHHQGEAATSALRGVLENREGYFSSETRASAVRALGMLLPADQGTPVAAAVADLDALVSLAAIAALAERDESTSAGALMGVLENRAGYYLPLTRLAAARALLRLRHCDKERLRGLLDVEYDATVREALSSLAAAN